MQFTANLLNLSKSPAIFQLKNTALVYFCFSNKTLSADGLF